MNDIHFCLQFIIRTEQLAIHTAGKSAQMRLRLDCVNSIKRIESDLFDSALPYVVLNPK